MLSVLLQFAASDYVFGIFKLYIIEIYCDIAGTIHMKKKTNKGNYKKQENK